MVNLFFSYSHKDEELRNELETHLALLKRQGFISSWHDRRITAGSDINQEISSELESAQIILLLVSAHFLNSDYCYEKEMKRALEKHNDKTAIVIPVILHPCDWHFAPFGSLRATPTDGKPISMYANQHEAFAIVAKDIQEAVANSFPQQQRPETAKQERVHGTLVDVERSSNLRIKRKFDDHERDEFMEDSYEYMARHFEGSLLELEARNPRIKARFKRHGESSFTASIYDNGVRVSQCAVSYGNRRFGEKGIIYSNSGEPNSNSFNEMLSVTDDGYSLQLKSLGMRMTSTGRDTMLSRQGAAEYYWTLLIEPLQ